MITININEIVLSGMDNSHYKNLLHRTKDNKNGTDNKIKKNDKNFSRNVHYPNRIKHDGNENIIIDNIMVGLKNELMYLLKDNDVFAKGSSRFGHSDQKNIVNDNFVLNISNVDNKIINRYGSNKITSETLGSSLARSIFKEILNSVS